MALHTDLSAKQSLGEWVEPLLEIQRGAVVGEEDGQSAEINEKLYSTVDDGVEACEPLGSAGRALT